MFAVEFVNTKTGDEGLIADGLCENEAASMQAQLRDPNLINRVWYVNEKEIRDGKRTMRKLPIKRCATARS